MNMSPRDTIVHRQVAKQRWLSVTTQLLLWTTLIGCTATAPRDRPSQAVLVDLQGHRGARGLLPENTIPSFLLAADLGVETIELDVVVSADSKVVVSHEPWFSHEICSDPDGRPVTEAEARDLNLYRMSYAMISRYDCGSRGNHRFPKQKKMAVSKPLLSDAIDAIELHLSESGETPVRYNVEIKSKEEGDAVYHPEPDAFARLVYDVVSEAGVRNRTTIQSFDPRALESVHRIDSTMTLALLVDNDLGFDENLERLRFLPAIYSPNYRLVDRGLVQKAHSRGLRVIPWTVNEETHMQRLLEMGVDGIITDYPGLGRKVIDTP